MREVQRRAQVVAMDARRMLPNDWWSLETTNATLAESRLL